VEIVTLIMSEDVIFKLLYTDVVSILFLQLPLHCCIHIISTRLPDVATALETAVTRLLREQYTDFCWQEIETHSTVSEVSESSKGLCKKLCMGFKTTTYCSYTKVYEIYTEKRCESHLVPRSRNEWNYTSTTPIRLHGVVLS
jgi:hypothetical protein